MSGVPSPEAPPQGARFDVAVVTPEFGPTSLGGLGTYVNSLVEGLVQRGLRIVVLAPLISADSREPTRVLSVGESLRLLLLPVREPPYMSRRGTETFSRRVERELSAPGLRVSCVHVHEYPAFAVGLSLKSGLGLPLVATFHQMELHRRIGAKLGAYTTGFGKGVLQRLEREVIRHADAVVCISEHVQKEVCRLGPRGIRARTLRTAFPPGPAASLPGPKARALRARFAPPNEKLVVFAGRPHPQKGIAPLVRATRRLLAERGDFRLVLLNGSLARSDVRLTARERGRVQFTEEVPHDEVLEVLQVADVGVVPSLFEPYGIVAVEMLAAGLPLVVSAAGGLQEISRRAASLGHPVFPVPLQMGEEGRPALDERALERALDQALALTWTPHERLLSQQVLAPSLAVAPFFEAHQALYRRLARRRPQPAPWLRASTPRR